ncbi:hypothetical protein D0T23_26425 [Duganella sp. BJB475]|nr:hypothetical protein D0T23_26425 [Duganella sp. BJB475]RFP25283.1 hypothetical protein D0T21_27455 [Duganella sp. BJB476]
MQHKDLENMTDSEYRAWLVQTNGVIDLSVLSEKNLVDLFSTTLRETDPNVRAQGLADVANMCLAMADLMLGAQSYVATCVVLNKH